MTSMPQQTKNYKAKSQIQVLNQVSLHLQQNQRIVYQQTKKHHGLDQMKTICSKPAKEPVLHYTYQYTRINPTLN
jgi:hypothetical protein